MKNNKIFNFALMIILFIFNMMFITSVLFIFKLKITIFNSIISLLLTFLIFFIIMKNKKYNFKEIIFNLLFLLGIILICIFISGKIYDTSYDGNACHKTAIGQLESGWNPVYQTIDEFNDSDENDLHVVKAFKYWNNHYAKGCWFYAASIYKITGNIETGKSISLLLLISTFLLLFSTLSKKLKPITNIIISGLITANPIIVCQTFTYYNDGLLSNFLIILFISLSLMVINNDIDKKLNYLLFFLSLCILINIKFTGFAYAGIYSLIFYIYILLKKDKRKEHLKNITIIGIVSIIVGVFIIGLSTYPKNIKTNGHPFYPLYGEGKIDIMENNAPKDFYKLNRFERLFLSNFVSTSNPSKRFNVGEIKNPFTVTKDEIGFYVLPDVRIGGYGPLYGVVIIFSVFCATYIIIKKIKDKIKIENSAPYMIVIFTTLALMVILKDAWWARYIPQFYLIPFSLILIIMSLNKTKISKTINFVFITLLVINIGLVSLPLLNSAYSNTVKINVNFSNLKIKKDTKLFIETEEFSGAVYNIKDRYKNVENIKEFNEDGDYKKVIILDLDPVVLAYYKEEN